MNSIHCAINIVDERRRKKKLFSTGHNLLLFVCFIWNNSIDFVYLQRRSIRDTCQTKKTFVVKDRSRTSFDFWINLGSDSNMESKLHEATQLWFPSQYLPMFVEFHIRRLCKRADQKYLHPRSKMHAFSGKTYMVHQEVARRSQKNVIWRIMAPISFVISFSLLSDTALFAHHQQENDDYCDTR